MAINSAIEVDLTGQAVADSIGEQLYSGIGGHADFMRGAAMARGGKPIIALPSTAKTKDGMRSRIVPFIQQGAGVVTTRGDMHYVVTEYGVAYLHGKTMRERAMSLIRIAHPGLPRRTAARRQTPPPRVRRPDPAADPSVSVAPGEHGTRPRTARSCSSGRSGRPTKT